MTDLIYRTVITTTIGFITGIILKNAVEGLAELEAAFKTK